MNTFIHFLVHKINASFTVPSFYYRSLTNNGNPGLHVDTEVDLLEQRRLAGVVEVGLVEAEDGRLQLGRLREAELDVVLARPLQQLRRALVLVVLLHLAPVLLLRGL